MSKSELSLFKGLSRLELCHILVSALSLTAGQAKSLTDIELDAMPLAKATLIKALLKSYKDSDYTLPMLIFSKVFGQSTEWGTEYMAAVKASKDIPVAKQIENLKNVIRQLEAKGAIEKAKA